MSHKAQIFSNNTVMPNWGEPERAPHWLVVFVYVGASCCARSVNKKIRWKSHSSLVGASLSEPHTGPLVGSLCIRRSVMLCAECEQKNPIEKPLKFCIRRSVTLCTECEQKKSDIKSHSSFVCVGASRCARSVNKKIR